MRLQAPETVARGVPAAAALALALAVAALALLAASPAKAQTGATFTVDRSDDRAVTAVPNPGDTCTSAANDCTLRDALANSNAVAGTDTIDFSVDEVTLSVPGRENQGATGDLDILQSVTIDGGAGVVIGADAELDGDRIFDISAPASATFEFVTVKDGGTAEEGGSAPQTIGGGFLVREGAELILRNSTVENNKAVGAGGGIGIFGPPQESSLAGGKATIERTTVNGNKTTTTDPQSGGGFGGGIFVDAGAELTLRDNSKVENNETLIAGGGIYLSNPPQNSTLAGGKATVEGSTVSGNKTTFSMGGGGGIVLTDSTTLTLSDSTVSANESASVSGGIASRGDVTVERSTVSNNKAARLAGGIGSGAVEGNTVAGNKLTIDSSTISGNTAGAAGGLGVISSPATVTNSTISNNTANGTPSQQNPTNGAGGGAAVAGNQNANLSLDHVTVAGNTANTAGGGLAIAPNNPATIQARNTIVAENTQNPQAGGQCLGTPTSVGTNLEFPGDSCGFQIKADPKLGELADNGGPTQTRALQSGSAAIDAATSCPPPATDQRGITRPQDGDNNATLACDIGAFELEETNPSLSISNAKVTEGDSGTTDATFTATLERPSARTVTVDYQTQNGTARAGSDYESTSGTLNFEPGQTSKTITVAVSGDKKKEKNETFFVNLSGAENANIADEQGRGKILNDDKKKKKK